MNFARIAIENSRITIIGIFLLVAMGITMFLNYPSSEDPSIAIRTASIDASFPGMSATRAEELIAVPIENAMREIAEIDEIRSTSKSGAVKVFVDIHDEVNDLEPVFQDIRNKIDDLRPNLPEGTRGPTVNDEEGLN
ncbi:efflux RND transporter permease subunit [Roseobacter denitrificans]|uniref:efflux RND transporter permease subunit n=1 Tax=Roseobacter denitrificans TaxID=2434 RepID=UPI0002DE1961|nr:efflux RND transporter permease subunit [Roseobacter denitrificans]SFF72775.1 AcrB/AcrD/AcrF family protein [Roseobacter denitrificans OCh 114]